jgi:hypothetical protein
MIIDPDRGARPRRNVMVLGSRAVGAGLLLSLLTLVACSDTINYARDGRSINLRDCTEWRTESIGGCYDGQGGKN